MHQFRSQALVGSAVATVKQNMPHEKLTVQHAAMTRKSIFTKTWTEHVMILWCALSRKTMHAHCQTDRIISRTFYCRLRRRLHLDSSVNIDGCCVARIA